MWVRAGRGRWRLISRLWTAVYFKYVSDKGQFSANGLSIKSFENCRLDSILIRKFKSTLMRKFALRTNIKTASFNCRPYYTRTLAKTKWKLSKMWFVRLFGEKFKYLGIMNLSVTNATSPGTNTFTLSELTISFTGCWLYFRHFNSMANTHRGSEMSLCVHIFEYLCMHIISIPYIRLAHTHTHTLSQPYTDTQDRDRVCPRSCYLNILSATNRQCKHLLLIQNRNVAHEAVEHITQIHKLDKDRQTIT